MGIFRKRNIAPLLGSSTNKETLFKIPKNASNKLDTGQKKVRKKTLKKTRKNRGKLAVIEDFHAGKTRRLRKRKAPLSSRVKNSHLHEEALEHIKDLEALSATQLKDKYPLTYTSWRDMKQRCRRGNGVLDPAFDLFRDFLRIMGPRPNKKYTIDRTDHENPTYGPDLCEWKDKKSQARNRKSTIYLPAIPFVILSAP
jgi:hypothetical protein